MYALTVSLLRCYAAAPSCGATREFHISAAIRTEASLEAPLFSLTGNVILADFRLVRSLAADLNKVHPEYPIRAGDLNAMGLIDEILHFLTKLYCEQVQPNLFDEAVSRINDKWGTEKAAVLLHTFTEQFPPRDVYAGTVDADHYLEGHTNGESHRALSLEELLLLTLANINPAFKPFRYLFDDSQLSQHTVYPEVIDDLRAYLKSLPPFGPDGQNLWDMLCAPMRASDSLEGQLNFMRQRWGLVLKKFTGRLFTSLDVLREENKPVFFGPGPSEVYSYAGLDEYERFSPDKDWMPNTVLIAKSTLVWLFQLSQKYGRAITQLDQIPDEELDILAWRGFTGLWLIGLWERSVASKVIKQWTGNPEAAASAYSLYDYAIAHELGGWEALKNLRERCAQRGIRLGSDMVPNHTGIDSRWIIEHPDRFLQVPYLPFPTYTYTCGNLSGRDDVTVQIEEHYFSRNDAAVVFKRIDNRTGETRYIYHGNDGTSMPWNDTAQIDFLNPEAREAVIQTIVNVCKQFPIVRFDAAMTLAKRHIQRLWYPEPGHGGDIPSRAEHAMSAEEFNQRIPQEFWREVVDRCAREAPETLLLAEAFWMMEGYFVRTLGMHRVYNSAFMNMLKNEDNAKYRMTIKNTLEFDPEVLKRFVNFMNNPDEEPAVVQFSKGDKYFGICTLLVTMPGLPMFGHGQIEGFEEKYGMEYRRSYRNESPDPALIERHEREIFPLMKRRYLFSGSAHFCLFDFFQNDGTVNEHVFAYSNGVGNERTLVLYNNSYYETSGWIRNSAVAIPQKDGGTRQDDIAAALLLHREDPYFVGLYEQRTALWYIRSSKDIAEHGLFAILSGYQAQVFLTIREVYDTDGLWAHLNATLNGTGVPDIDTAVFDMSMTDIFTPFMQIFERNQLKDYSNEHGETLVRNFLEAVRVRTHSRKTLNKLCEEYTVYMQRFKTLTMYIEEIRQRRSSKKANRLRIPPYTVLFLQTLTEQPNILPYIIGYTVLTLLRSVSTTHVKDLIAQWQLDRKLCEAYTALGIPEHESRHVVAIMCAILARTGIDRKKPVTAQAIIEDNYHEADFRAILGINVFEDIPWFNKELYEETLIFAPLFCVLESARTFDPPRKDSEISQRLDKARLEAVSSMVHLFRKAEPASKYQLAKLLDFLSDSDEYLDSCS
ncbi:alpha-amylase [Pillotina sp. SPG140]|jgi:hypothetical protein